MRNSEHSAGLFVPAFQRIGFVSSYANRATLDTNSVSDIMTFTHSHSSFENSLTSSAVKMSSYSTISSVVVSINKHYCTKLTFIILPPQPQSDDSVAVHSLACRRRPRGPVQVGVVEFSCCYFCKANDSWKYQLVLARNLHVIFNTHVYGTVQCAVSGNLLYTVNHKKRGILFLTITLVSPDRFL